VITQSGVHIQKIGGVEGTPTAEDIAVHAGRICRFGGAIWYPLLPHLIFVGLMAYKRSGNIANMLWGFLHDAHEVATSDVPRPFKCNCMRKEQTALDNRLLRVYFNRHKDARVIDFDLIKQCDIEACHIEAVQLGVPGFAETELKYSSSYTGATHIHDAPEDVELFNRIMSRSFGKNTIQGRESLGVALFSEALQFAEVGDYDGFLDAVIDWGLL
jgi:hypothetical protein